MWRYAFAERTITIAAIVSASEPDMTWRIVVEGAPCRFLVFGQLVLGEPNMATPGGWRSTAGERPSHFDPIATTVYGEPLSERGL